LLRCFRALQDPQTGHCYRSQLIARIQLEAESLEESAAVMKQLAYWALVRLPKHFIHIEDIHIHIGIRDRDVKQQLLMSGDKTFNEALKLEAAKAAA
jgi:hypothetical protein